MHSRWDDQGRFLWGISNCWLSPNDEKKPVIQWSGQRTFTSEGKASVKGFGQEGTERNKWTVTSTVGNKVRKIGRHFIYFYVFIWLCHVLVEACRTQLPKQGSNPASLHWECRVLAIGPPGKFLCSWSELHLVLLARSTPSRRTIFRAQLQSIGNSCKYLWQSLYLWSRWFP